jgi:hypothetical protein
LNWPEDPGDWPHDDDRVQGELEMLVELMDYRDGVMAEAIAQSTGIIPYFQGLAGFTAASHPQTTNLCFIALNIGQFMVMYYKEKYARPRPSQLLPALLPSMDVPGHASYPSGHSTESHLIAHFLRHVLGKDNPASKLLHPLAHRIAINREVMGLHYRSDSEAGEKLAKSVFELALKVSGLKDPYLPGKLENILKSTIEEAQAEWNVAG